MKASIGLCVELDKLDMETDGMWMGDGSQPVSAITAIATESNRVRGDDSSNDGIAR